MLEMAAVQMVNGALTEAERREVLEEHFAPYRDDFVEAFGWDPTPMCEAFVKNKRGFSFAELERSIATREGSDGRRRHFQPLQEALTTSQAAASISLIMIHAIQDAYTLVPAIFRTLAQMEQSNGDSEVYPDEFLDDLPQQTAETEPAPESRMGQAVIRIKNYQYTRALAISKRWFDLDKTGQAKRAATQFGSKYPIVQDRQFIWNYFRQFIPANLITAGGFIPGTNIAGYGPGNGFGGGTAYAGVTGVPADFNPQAGPITPYNIENALLAPATFVDPYGVEIGAGVEFDTLLVDSLDRFKAKRFVQSNVNPVQLLTSGDQVTSGQAPGAFTDNILKGEFSVASSPYVKKSRAPLSGSGYPWAMLKKGDSGIVMQIESDWKVEQETPLAGQSFDQATLRWRGEGWFGTGVTMRAARCTFVGN